MRDDPFSEGVFVRYLLGDLPEEEQVEIEERAFQDHQYLRNLQASESDLIDEYVRGGLSKRERQQFENRFFASAERRRKVEFARALASVTPEFAAKEKGVVPAVARAPITWRGILEAFLRSLSPAARYSMVAAALLVMIGGSWLIAESLRLRGQLAELRAEQQSRASEHQALEDQIADEQARRADLSGQLEREREQRARSDQLAAELQRQLEESTTQPTQPGIVSLALWPGVPRGGSARPKLTLPQSARLVRVQIGIEPEDEYQTFRVELRGPDGRPIWTQADLSARRVRAGRQVVLSLPARILTAGQYELALKGVTSEGATEDVGYRYFEVLKK